MLKVCRRRTLYSKFETEDTGEKTIIDEFKEVFGIVSDNTADSMISVLNTLKENSTDTFRNYMYDILIDAIPALIEENPEAVLKIRKDLKSGGYVNSEGGRLLSVNINANLLNTLDLTKETAINVIFTI